MPKSQPDLALAAALRKIRLREELTQEALALLVGLSVRAVARIERGEADPGWGTVRSLAEAMGVAPLEVVALAERIDQE